MNEVVARKPVVIEQEHCLLRYLLAEREEYKAHAVPAGPAERRRLLRALLNVRPPKSAAKRS